MLTIEERAWNNIQLDVPLGIQLYFDAAPRGKKRDFIYFNKILKYEGNTRGVQ